MQKFCSALIITIVLLAVWADRAFAQGWPPKNGATVPATCIAGEFFYVTTSTTTTPYRCTSTNTWIAIQATDPIYVNVKDFGAKCDAVTDDSVALQAAINFANTVNAERIVKLPANFCAFSTPLIIGDNASIYGHVSIEGVSEDTSGLAYTGPNNLAAVQLRNLAYFTFSKFVVGRSPADKGTSVGVLLTNDIAGTCINGTCTLTGTFSHFGVSGFNVGMQAGESNFSSASEIQCWHCSFQINNTGWAAQSQNSLNFWFYGLGIGQNQCGMYLLSDSPTIIGGHSHNNTTADFCLAAPFGTLLISNFRAESASQFIAGVADRVVLQNNTITLLPNSITIDIAASYVLIEGNSIQGKIQINGEGRYIIRNNDRFTAAADGYPAQLTAGASNAIIEYENNIPVTGFRTPDAVGLALYGTFYPWRIRRHEITDVPGGGENLGAIRGLAYGSNIQGRNLRDQVTFATSGTANYTFKRTLSVDTVNGSRTLTYASNALTSKDIGKKIVVPDVIDTACGTDPSQPAIDSYDGRILVLASATTATTIPLQWHYYSNRCGQQYPTITTTKTATIGEDEPDTNYLIVGLSCDKQETFSWSALATTGFTLTSSNASSTATCSFMIVR